MMTNNQVTGIIDAINTVFESFSQRRITCKGASLLQKENCGGDIAVMIELIGDLQGSLYMTMNTRTGCEIASELLGGMELDGVGELVISAVSELCNMIMGNACSNISKDSIQIDITPPTVVLGEQFSLTSAHSVVSIPMELENVGTIDFDVALKTA